MNTHLNRQERYQIDDWLSQGLKVRQIAARLGRHRSTIYRELKRCQGAYEALAACQHRRERALRCAANAPRHCSAVWRRVQAGLAQQWSPQQVAGRARLEQQRCASWQAIYGWIRRCWPQPQRSQRPLRRAFKPAVASGWARHASPIAQRPKHVRLRQELGHWELDTMVGVKGQRTARLLVGVERASGYVHLSLLHDGKPQSVVRSLQRGLLAQTALPVLSVTVDRGGEFSLLPELLGPQRLFVCDPHQPNQRGTNENTIGLLRQYLPKSTPMSTQSDESIAKIQDKLNNRPRARYGFRTPSEVASEPRLRCRDSN